MKRILIATASLLVLISVEPAFAVTLLTSPWAGAPVSVRIGSQTINQFGFTITRQIIVWERKADGACQAQVIGNASGLSDDYIVRGTEGSDRLSIQRAGRNQYCGRYSLDPLVYGGRYVDLEGLAGNDILSCGDGDTHMSGNDGNDGMYSENSIGWLNGGAGNDSVFSWSLGSGERLSGGLGDDCLYDFWNGAAKFDCGPGNDAVIDTRPLNAVSCERTVSTCGDSFIP